MLYHINIAWPMNVPQTVTREHGIACTPTRHALERSLEKGFRCPRVIPCGAQAFEVEMLNPTKLKKIAFRWSYSSSHDICVVVSSDGRIITCWLNNKNDVHSTLDRAKYCRTASAA